MSSINISTFGINPPGSGSQFTDLRGPERHGLHVIDLNIDDTQSVGVFQVKNTGERRSNGLGTSKFKERIPIAQVPCSKRNRIESPDFISICVEGESRC
jgi:hypothetical protein